MEILAGVVPVSKQNGGDEVTGQYKTSAINIFVILL